MSRILVDAFNIPDFIEPLSIKSAGHHILLSHLVRTLVVQNKEAQLEGDLAKSWETRDNLVFTFKLRPSMFSDGTPIVASDFVATVHRQMQHQSAIHFDFKAIKEVTAPDDSTVRIVLHTPVVGFIRKLTSPEFGVLKKSETQKKSGQIDFSCTSGPYRVTKKNHEITVITKNPFYDFLIDNSPDEIEFQSTSDENKIKLLERGKVDFAIPLDGISSKKFRDISSHPLTKLTVPHIGFTFWISINPTTIPNIQHRHQIQNIVSKTAFSYEENPGWTRANQLFLPDGEGRPSPTDLTTVWKSISQFGEGNFKVLKLLAPAEKLPFMQSVLSEFKKAGVNLTVEKYKNQDQFVSKQKNGAFDLLIVNNDFSSSDLTENVEVTFASSRPLILLEKESPVFELLERLKKETDDVVRQKSLAQIGLELLKNGSIAPIAYSNLIFAHNKRLDLSRWSRLFPEISFWKTSLSK